MVFKKIIARPDFFLGGRSGGKRPFGWWEIKKKRDGNSGDSARGQADPGSPLCTPCMDRPGPVICMYVCVGTVSHPYGPTDPLVVVLLKRHYLERVHVRL